MQAQARDRAAEMLLAARKAPIAGLPEDCRPATVDQGYAIQDAVTARIGLRVIGRKLGCTAEAQQRFLGVDGPFAGRMFAETSYATGVTLPAGDFIMRGIEAEFAFRLARDLPSRPIPYGQGEIADAVATAHPALEIVCTRFRDWRAAQVGAPSLVADNGAHGAFIEGPGMTDWRRFDLPRHGVTLSVDGQQLAQGTGAEVLGHPLTALTWAANALAQRGQPLRAGDIVSTGTCVGIHLVGPSAKVVADFGALGWVELRFG